MASTEHAVIALWPDGAPGSESWDQVERETVVPEWDMPIVHNVTQPSLTVYPAAEPNGAAVIVAPGGAFRFLAIEHEGHQVAAWLSERGITAYILKYRLLPTGPEPWKEGPGSPADRDASREKYRALLPLIEADAAQAMRIVRGRADEWAVDPDRVGVIGFSAGGVVASLSALDSNPETRPAFAAPIYGAPLDEIVVPADAPPLFLACAQDDEMARTSSLRMHAAWTEAERPVELHIYAAGGHGFGMRRQGLPCDTWIERLADWLHGIGMV